MADEPTFTPKVWENQPIHDTPIDADGLVDMETRLSAFSTEMGEWALEESTASGSLEIPSLDGYSEGQYFMHGTATYDEDTSTWTPTLGWTKPVLPGPPPPFMPGHVSVAGTGPLGDDNTAGPGLAVTKDGWDMVHLRGSVILTDDYIVGDNEPDGDQDERVWKLCALGGGSTVNKAPLMDAGGGQTYIQIPAMVQFTASDGDTEVGKFVPYMLQITMSGPQANVWIVIGADDAPIPAGSIVWLDGLSYRAAADS